MSIKKTIAISVIFHLVIFSAALLFSAVLFKGSGNTPDEKVFFVKLSVESNETDNIKLVSKKKAIVPAKVHVIKQKKKNPVEEKPSERVKPDIALEKAPELSKEKTAEI